ncbi:LOW QUALITY PROTEIN: hypothetical protein HZS_3298 [Henneguya salminicola]|nr:LOW QUALITY PROTEIN: hypothetical protein HZS_3298 [Henneguya salminicola]
MQLIFDQCLKYLSLNSIIQLLMLIQCYASTTENANNSIVATSYLMTISDYFCETFQNEQPQSQIEYFWTEFFNSFCKISSDPRMSIRKSVIQMLFNIIQVRNTSLNFVIIEKLIKNELVPLLELSSQKATDTLSLEDSSFSNNDTVIYHHSRNTPQKQWMETYLLILDGSGNLCSQFIQNLTTENFMSLTSITSFLEFLKNSILYSNIELNFHSTYCFYVFCTKMSENNRSGSVEFWRFSYDLIRVYYQNILDKTNEHNLPYVLQQFTLMVQILDLTLPNASSDIGVEDINLWFSVSKTFLASNFSKPSWFIPRHLIDLLNQSCDVEAMDFYHTFKSFLICNRKCFLFCDNFSLIKHFLKNILDLLYEILENKYLNTSKCQEALLSEATIFYVYHLPNYQELVEFYKYFVEIWREPLVKKYNYIIDHFWSCCIPSIIEVSKISILPYISVYNGHAHFSLLIDMIEQFLFYDANLSPIVSSIELSNDSNTDTQLISFLSTIIIPGFAQNSDKLIVKIVSLLLRGFISVRTTSKNMAPYSENFNLREGFNVSCLRSLIHLSLGTFDTNQDYILPNNHTSFLVLNKLTDSCFEISEKLLTHPNEDEFSQLAVEVACSLKAIKSVFFHCSTILMNKNSFNINLTISFVLNCEFLQNVNIQLMRLYDTCVSLIKCDQPSLRILIMEAMKEFKKIFNIEIYRDSNS